MNRASRSDGLWVFFALTYVFSWLFWLIAIFSKLVNNQSPGILLYLLGGSGPSIVGVILLYRSVAPAERSGFWRRAIDLRAVQPAWWLLAFVGIPTVWLLSLGVNYLIGGSQPGAIKLEQLVAHPWLLIPNVLMGIIGGPLLEELGWRGFALDRMLKRWHLLPASLILGLIWFAWHLPLFFFPGPSAVEYSFGFGTELFWIYLFSIVSLSVIIAYAYAANRRSIFLAILIHFMYNFTPSLFAPINPQIRLYAVIFQCLLALGVVLSSQKPSVSIIQAAKV